MNTFRFDPGLSRLVVTGGDRRDFLHRMTTNDVGSLAPGQGCVTLLLERTGRLVDRLLLLERGEDCLLIGTGARAAAVVEWIERFVIADDVMIRDVSADTLGTVVAGTDAVAALAAAGLSAPSAAGEHAELDPGDGRVTVARDPGAGDPRFHVVAAHEPAFLSGIPAGSAADWDRVRVEARLPAYGTEWDERTIPLEAGLTQAISFTKGCYVGQEIVARVHNHKRVKRVLVQIEIAGEDEPAPGAALSAGGAEVGRITSTARVGERVVALARVETAHGAPGARLALDNGTAVTVTPIGAEEGP